MKVQIKGTEAWLRNICCKAIWPLEHANNNIIIQQNDSIMKSFANGVSVDVEYYVTHDIPNPILASIYGLFIQGQGKNVLVNSTVLKVEALNISLKF